MRRTDERVSASKVADPARANVYGFVTMFYGIKLT